jgi:hypothetical protein
MSLATFLSALAACAGFFAACFYAAGAALLTPGKILEVASTHWDANPAWADSLAAQRADYVAGSLLLVVSFALQIAAVFTTSTRTVACGVGWLLGASLVLLLAAVTLRVSVANRTKATIRLLGEARAKREAVQ